MASLRNVNTINANNRLQKCGEITTRRQNEFFLSCMFCEEVFLKLDDFIAHIGHLHLKDIYDEINLFDDDTKGFTSAVLSKETKFVEKKKAKGNLRNITEARNHQNNTAKHIEVELKNSSKLEGGKILTSDAEEDQPMELAIERVEAAEIDENYELRDPFTDEEFDNSSRCAEIEQSEIESDFDMWNDMVDTEHHHLIGDKVDMTIAIIAEYEKQPLLWGKKYSNTSNRVKREEALQQIASNVNKQFNTNLDWKIVNKQIKNLRKKYHTEVQNQKDAESKGKPFITSSYTNKLQFLGTVMKNNQRRIESAKRTTSGLPFSNLSEAQNVKLINIYKSFPCLWDLQHIAYRFKNRRQEALFDMQEAIRNELSLNLTLSQLQRKIGQIRHTYSQEKQRKLKCESKTDSYEPISQYYQHITFLEGNVGPFKCAVCGKQINAADHYQIHKSSHDGSMPFICPICNRGFMKVGNCTVHLRRHTRDYQFECEICKKRFATSTDMTVHKRGHTGEKPYFCEICGRSFRTWNFFDSHMRRHQKRAMHKCTICSRAFYQSGKLAEHMKAHLNVRDKVCNVCGKAFTSTKYLRQHKQIHAEKKKYVCKICEKGFAQYAGLSGHMKSHGTTLIARGAVGTAGAENESAVD